MTRLAPFLSVVLLVAYLPGGLAGPACSRKHYKTADCVQKCMSKWGWTGRMMGTDPWGIVLKNANSTESFAAAIAKACGTETTPTSQLPSPSQVVGNVQTGHVIYSSEVPISTSVAAATTSTDQEIVATSSVAVAAASVTTSSVTVISAAGFAPPAFRPTTSSSSGPSVPPAPVEPATTSSAPPPSPPPPPPLRTTSTPPPPPVSTSSTRPPVTRTTSTPAPPPPTKTPEPAPGFSPGGGFSFTSDSDITAYLTAHNTVRAQHGAAPLTWSDDLASKAQQWANGCVFEHSGGIFGRLGENLAAGTGNYDIAQAVKGWTDEVTEYNPSNPTASHFTQVVWKATTQVGCAVQSCDGIFDPKFGKANYFVCEYDPAGNVSGQFGQNVQV